MLDTTRSPRPGESNGIQYHFVTRTEFEDLIKQDAFIEHAQFSGNYYGTSIRAVEDVAKVGGRRCVLDIDSQVSSRFSAFGIPFRMVISLFP